MVKVDAFSKCLYVTYHHTFIGKEKVMKNESDNKKTSENLNPADVLADATNTYFNMLNKSLAKYNSHRDSNQKEIKNGTRITNHRISL